MHAPASINRLPVSKRVTSLAGEGKIWLCAMGLSLGILMTFGLLLLILVEGLAVFWPKEVVRLTLAPKTEGQPPTLMAGEVRKVQHRRNPANPSERTEEWQLFIGNKDATGQAFIFIDASSIQKVEKPADIMVAERMEYGDSIFYPVSLKLADGREIKAEDPKFEQELESLIKAGNKRRSKITEIEKDEIGAVNRKLSALNLEIREMDQQGVSGEAREKRMARINAAMAQHEAEFEKLKAEAGKLREEQKAAELVYRIQDGTERKQHAGDLVAVMRPNALSWWSKLGWFLHYIWEFVAGEPREANTEGGIFPAIFGTFVMTVLMSALVTPVGVIAAIYLREYAKQGLLVRSVRISVNNLAGVPSIVFGVFGLGFFVYFMGGAVDKWLFSSSLPTPTFGTGGIFWASLTLALLTLPVIIVATEEALGAVPRGVREAALACGASKWQTIQRIVLPAALPGILTGVVLAMARGAGEVAPLMLVGVVKLAPTLPLDTIFPFVHAERKFMHLGFHIYDLGFQSPDSEAAKPMVFATTLFLILMVVVLNLSAILMRNHIRKKYAISAF